MKSNFRDRLRWFLAIALTIFLLTIAIPFAVSQPLSPSNPIDNPIDNLVNGSAVLLDGETLFVIQARVGSFSAAERAQAVTQRVKAIAADPVVSQILFSDKRSISSAFR